MKKLFVLFVLFCTLASCSLQQKEKQYCGKVIRLYPHEYPVKYSMAVEYYIVFYCPELKRNIPVLVTMNCYVNTKLGENVCFSLTEYDLKR